MDAVFSGQVGTLAILEGPNVRFFRASSLKTECTIGREGLSYLFSGATDVVLVRGVESSVVWKTFEVSLHSDRALRLLLIGMEVEEDDGLRVDAGDAVEELLQSKDAVIFVENQLYSRPLPDDADPLFLDDEARWPTTSNLVREIIRKQHSIRFHRNSWDELDPILFENMDKASFEEAAINLGAFRALASVDPKTDPNLAILQCYKLLAQVPNARAVISEWSKQFKRAGIKRVVLPEEEIDDERFGSDLRPVESYERFRKVVDQQDVIVRKLRTGNLKTARKYTDELIAQQLRENGATFAAKSLCKLAQIAKEFGIDALQLEWTERAVAIAPSDSWSHGQYGDALLQFSRLNEAAAEYNLCDAYGDGAFAATGRARILRHQGHLDEALAAYRAVQAKYPDDPFNWMGSAETLRDMWKFEDAVQEYRMALKLFPESSHFKCGYAAVLADLGRAEEALQIYSSNELRDDLVALNGRAGVLKDLGRVDEALDTISRAIELYPASSVSRCLKAEIYRVIGRFDDALQLYSDVKIGAPNSSVAFAGYAEVLRDLRRYQDSLAAYSEAVEQFPFNSYLANGFANICKVSGDFQRSLQLYESNVKRFPHSLFAKSGRADLLKRLGRYDDALDAYDAVIRSFPGFASAKNGKAAILVVRRQFEEAIALLPSGAPSTRDDWVSWHIRGMALLRQDRVDNAIQHFEKGRKEAPFIRERRAFERAIGAAKLRQGEFREAVEALKDSGTTGLSSVLRFHAYAGLGNKSQVAAAYAELATRCPPQLIELKEAIAGRFGFLQLSMSHQNDNWIFDREAEAILQEAA